MSSLTWLVANDLRLQWRQGFYAAYLFVSLMYFAVLRAMSDDMAEFLLPIIVFTDPAVLGAFFVGGLLMLERSDNTLQALFITPVSLSRYVASKILSLSILSLLTSVAISVSTGFMPVQPALFCLSVLLTSSFFILVGLTAASMVKSINAYMLSSVLFITPLMLPLLGPLGVYDSSLFLLFPAGAALKLLYAGLLGSEISGLWVGLCSISLLAWNVLAYALTLRQINKHVLGRVDAP